MARTEDLAQSASNDEWSSESNSDYSSKSYSESSGSSEKEEESDEDEEAKAAKKQLVRADIDAMRRMMSDMDAIRARLQQRFTAERQAKIDLLACEDRKREEQAVFHREADEVAGKRLVNASAQTDSIVEPSVAQQSPYLADATAPAVAATDVITAVQPTVDGNAGVAAGAPIKSKPAGLRLYDLVKASEFDLSRRVLSPVHQGDSPKVLSARSSSELGRVFSKHQQPMNDEKRSDLAAGRSWDDSNPLLGDSVVGDGGEDSTDRRVFRRSAGPDPSHSLLQQSTLENSSPPSQQFDENSASLSNSLDSIEPHKQSAVSCPKFNAAALLSTGKQPHLSAMNYDDKTDEQREREAVQYLLFHR